MVYIGINIGALAVKAVILREDRVRFRLANHQGDPSEVIRELVAESPAGAFFGVSGHLGQISEVAATEAALNYVQGDFDAVASLGGEVFAVYLLEGTRVLRVISHNKCAAGSGEFFIQQIARLGLDLEEAIDRSFAGKVVPIASRCSVHCKSDVTHKLNRQEASVEDVLHTLHDSMAEKVVSLLEKAGRSVNRLLVVGGMTRNRAMIAALAGKLPRTQVIVLPESTCFEALGTALLVRDKPIHHSPVLTAKYSFASLPPLAQFTDGLTIVSPSPPIQSAKGPLILGVDAGSTTTKAVLLDPEDCGIVASHYRRTNGDPVGAARECLRALIDQVGNGQVCLVGATGSAREVVGAYLGTAQIYNEISAHATGALHFDPDVETIFEIGGQDAKYILLRNSIPIDYAMNGACSAGTGSFLEECAQSDLGLSLTEIADVALRATAPVQFKATCAAFINSDIRAALQEGSSPQDVTAGLVYAIAQNYLTKVKGARPVGAKVFLQGGVAMNRAVAHAFVQHVGKPVVVPPHPELMGAIGVALLALGRQKTTGSKPVDLASLAAPSIRQLGKFICEGCENHCTIDRLEVAGRRFPFGGRCSRFENMRKRKKGAEEEFDLVEARNRLVFAPAALTSEETRSSIGIPRALTAHSLYPLYSTFFTELGFRVVLSNIDPAGALKTNSEFCFPVQLAHDAVLDLAKAGMDIVFLPHLIRMPNPHGDRDSYLCPVAQACPYFASKAFPGVRFLTPVLNFAEGYETSTDLIELGFCEFGVPRCEAEAAYEEAIAAQVQIERSMHRLGQEALTAALQDDKPTVVLAGRSYNAFPAEASQSVGKKLASMGVRVIPADCLLQQRAGPTAWHYPNIILNAAKTVRRHPNLFLLYVSSFSCTIDAFTHSILASELGDKPYMILEIDAHTADAGVQTRLEAFLDIIENHQPAPSAKKSFAPATVEPDGTVTSSTGEEIRLTDPRVKLYFPSFSYYHSRAVAAVASWQRLNVGGPLDLKRDHLERGLQFTSGRECLPLPICIGQMLDAYDRRAPDEIVGFYMLRGGAPCVVDCYVDYLRQVIRENKLDNLFIFDPHEANHYYGLRPGKMGAFLASLITLADLFAEMEQSLLVVGEAGSAGGLRTCWNDYVGSASSAKALEAKLGFLIDQIAAIPHTDPARCPKVVVTGDFFTRFNPTFMEGVQDRYAQNGIILVPADLSELLLYGVYTGMATAAQAWGVSPDSLWAVALACAKVFRPDGRSFLAKRLHYHRLQHCEERYRALFRQTGLLVAPPNDMQSLFQCASQHISPAIVGEAIPTVGKGVAADREGYHGIIIIGPFNCLPFRISEAILKPYSVQENIPLLVYESDGFSVSPAFLRQVDVHIQQVLGRRPAGKAVAGG